MSQEQQEDENKQVIKPNNLTQEDEENSKPASGSIEIGGIENSFGNAIGHGASVVQNITNNQNFYNSSSYDEKAYTLTLDNWYKVCHAKIEKQKQTRLTTNLLTNRNGIKFLLNDVYVPVELVEQKQRPKHSNNILAEESSSLYLPRSESITDNQFFEKVLYEGKSEKTKELRIAIIGEPGSGKTTFLQKIADWLLNTKKEIVIWVSLSDLQTKNLEDYLKEVWLKAALPDISPKLANVNEAVQNALAQLFNTNRVWLLLDGADEMNAGGENPLSVIANNLNSWVGKARVILSCRLNVWDIEKNALEEFKTYRTLEFSYDNTATSNQIHNFISNWFKNISLEQGKLLETVLNQPGNERLKDLVRNPLRLALLCRIWQSEEGYLPDTKVQLYSQYVKAIYSWKQDLLNQKQQQLLNQALGELAKRGIESRESRFRLREKLVREVLEPELFNLAFNIGWLNRVGETTEKPKEDVYAFLHGTFQEYFAAQRITDWRFFINYESDNIQPIKYPIFAPRWKEVILLWLQQSESKVSRLQKLEFIEALVDFTDKYHGDNIFKTCTFLIAECLIEAGLTEHCLYNIFYKKIVRIYRHSPYKLLQERSFKILKKFDNTLLFSFLKEELKSNKKNRYLKAVETLGEIATEQAIELLANQYLKEGEEPAAIVNALMVTNSYRAKEKIEEIIKQLGEDEEELLISGIINQLVNANRQDYINLLINILQNSQTPQWMQSVILQHLGSVNHPQVNDIFTKHLEQALNNKNITRIVDLLNNINYAVEENIILKVKNLFKSEQTNLVTASIRFLARHHRISREELITLSKQNCNQYELQKEIFTGLIQIQSRDAEKDAIKIFEICQSESESWYFIQWIDTFGKFGNVFSFEFLSQELHSLINDLSGDWELEVSIIKALYQISKRLHYNQTINQNKTLCQDILKHLQISGCGDDYLADAAVNFVFQIGNANYIKILLKLAEEELEIDEAFLSHINQYNLKSEYEDLINDWIDEKLKVDEKYLEDYFNIKVRLLPTKEKKRKIVIAHLEGGKPLLYRGALSIACNLLQPEEILDKSQNFLDSSDFSVVEKMIEVLGEIGDAATVYQLLPFLRNNHYQQEAFKALFNVAERHLLLGSRKFQEMNN